MTFERIRISSTIQAALFSHAQADSPNECCGLLAGVVADGIASVVAHYPLINALASPTEFESEPRSMLHAVRDMRERQIDVVAIYHSHPTSPPVPSRKDLARNWSEDIVNFIISLGEDQPTMRGWWLTAQTYREATWEIVDDVAHETK